MPKESKFIDQGEGFHLEGSAVSDEELLSEFAQEMIAAKAGGLTETYEFMRTIAESPEKIRAFLAAAKKASA